MARTDEDKIQDILQERYDWINLLKDLKQRYPTVPEGILGRVIVRCNGNKVQIENILLYSNNMLMTSNASDRSIATSYPYYPERQMDAYTLHDRNTTGSYLHGYYYRPTEFAGMGSNNLDPVQENQLDFHFEPLEETGPVSLTNSSLGNTGIGNTLKLQHQKYNELRKKTESIRREVEKTREHVSKEEEDLNARSVVAKNPTLKEIKVLEEQYKTLQQDLLKMFKELDDLGKPWSGDHSVSKNVRMPELPMSNFVTAPSVAESLTGGITSPSNRPASRFPYPAPASTQVFNSAQMRLAFPCTTSFGTPRTMPFPHDRTLSYPPIEDNTPEYDKFLRQISAPNRNVIDDLGSELQTSNGDENDGKWNCKKCTYLNHAAISVCEICNLTRK